MTFTGQLGTVNSMPSQIVPMLGAGGTKRSISLSGSLSLTGVVAGVHHFVFNQVSISLYRAVARTRTFVTIFRTEK